MLVASSELTAPSFGERPTTFTELDTGIPAVSTTNCTTNSPRDPAGTGPATSCRGRPPTWNSRYGTCVVSPPPRAHAGSRASGCGALRPLEATEGL